MSEFKIGDRVEVNTLRGDHPRGSQATVVEDSPFAYAGELTLRYDDESIHFARPYSLKLAPAFVHETTFRTIWVTLPGDNAGHRLTEAQAKQLLRELEEVV